MSDTELKIKVSADGATIRELEMRIKELRAEFKASRIGSDEFNIAAKELKKTLEQKTVAVRVAETENAKLMRSYFTLGENLRKNTNPAFVSFNQVIQDAPFGIRGVGNNIQFLTQQFTQLRASGMSTGDILKGIVQNALTPMGGLMLAVSSGTSLLTVAMDQFGKATKEAGTQTIELNKHLEDLSKDELVRTYKQLQAQLKWFEMQATIEEIKLGFTDKPIIDPQSGAIIGFEAQANKVKTLTDKFKTHRDELKKTLTEIEEIIYGKERKEEKNDKAPLKSLSTGMLDVGFDSGPMSTKAEYDKVFGAIEDKRRQLEEDGIKYQQQQAEELAQIREDAERRSLKKTEDNLRSAMNLYNSVFFSPLKAGFEAIASGSGNMADAFIQSLKKMIAQLIEFALFSSILSFASPGAGGFMSIFGNMAGLTSLATPVTTGGTSNRSTLSRISSRSMNRGGGLKVQVVGKLGNDAIYLSGNRYLSMNNAAKY
jgi:hypothetical protein